MDGRNYAGKEGSDAREGGEEQTDRGRMTRGGAAGQRKEITWSGGAMPRQEGR